MEYNELISFLTDGMDADTKAAIIAGLEKGTVKTRAVQIKAQAEFDKIQQQAQALQTELDGTGAQPGSRAYQKWYQDNWEKIQNTNNLIEAYEKRNGAGSFARASEEGGPPTAAAAGLDENKVKEIISTVFRENQAPNIVGVVKNAGRIVQRHMFAGRKNEIDFDKLDEIIGEQAKKGRMVTLEEAYNIWDAPEREKAQKLQTDAEITRRVNEELQKRGASTNFPAAVDSTPSALSQKSKADMDKFDKVELNKGLVDLWNNPTGSSTQ